MCSMKLTPGRYVLGGQRYLPGRPNDFRQGGAMAFTIEFPEGIDNDAAAISAAENTMRQEREHAKPGFVVGGTLYHFERIVKNFADE